MFAVVVVLGVVLALAFFAAGGSKLAGAPRTTEMADHLGITRDRYRLIGVPEILGAAGVLLGLAVAPVGIAAGLGLATLTTGAAITHRRAEDGPREIAPAILLTALAITYVMLRAVTS